MLASDGRVGPHAPRALLELSYPRSRARRVLKANGKPPASRGAPHRTRVEIRSGWDSASVGHLVCLVQTCVKGPLCYVMLCYVMLHAPAAEGRAKSAQSP